MQALTNGRTPGNFYAKSNTPSLQDTLSPFARQTSTRNLPLAFSHPISSKQLTPTSLRQHPRLNHFQAPQSSTALRAAPSDENTTNAPNAVLLPKQLDANNKLLLPVEKVVGLEGLRKIAQANPTVASNPFLRMALPGIDVSRLWTSRVKNLKDKGPFPTAQKQISFPLKSGKNINVLVTYPTQNERGRSQDFPLVLYSPPGFIGEVKFPIGSFFDAQLGQPSMEHFASYGMVSATILDTSSVLLDGVENVNHQKQADELNEIIDLLLSKNSPLPQNNIPPVDTTRIGTLSYSRGAKVALLAAADRLKAQREKQTEDLETPPENSPPIDSATIKIVSIAKDPVNIGGVPKSVMAQIPPCVEAIIPETYNTWAQSTNRFPVAPLPDAPANAHFPIEEVTDPVLMFSADLNWVNADADYAAKVFYDALPPSPEKNNLLVEVDGTHESWVTDYGIKGDSMALMTAYLLTHLAERDSFQHYLTPDKILKESECFKSVTQTTAKKAEKN